MIGSSIQSVNPQSVYVEEPMSGFTLKLTLAVLLDLIAMTMSLEPASRDIILRSMVREAGYPVSSFSLPTVGLLIG